MKSRQRDFLRVVKHSIEVILNEETPYLLNYLFRFFHNKVSKQISSSLDSVNIYETVALKRESS